MSEPTMRCLICERVIIVRPDGRGFPPDIAKRKLAKLCARDGHAAAPSYRAGIGESLIRFIQQTNIGEPNGTDG